MNCEFQKLPEIYSRVYQAIDSSVAVGAALASSEATVQRALQQFRNSCADPEALEQLEAISLTLHGMRLAAVMGKAEERACATEALIALAERWIGRLPIH